MSDKNKNTNGQGDDDIITDSGSYVANVDSDARGRRGAATNDDAEEKITSTGSYVATADGSARGRRGAKKDDPEEKITGSGSYVATAGSDQRGRRGVSNKGGNAKGGNAPKHRAGDTVQAEYDINGKTYKGLKLISASTGEAKIVLVENGGKKFALKIYHANIGHRPSQEVLAAVSKSRGNGVLIDIYEYGVWNNPEVDGAECDYEIMQYCDGGALTAGSLHGKPDELREVTLRMVAAADYCSRIGVLHRDIKPENFFWVDKEHTRLVLGDFGLACICPKGSSVPCEDHRTKIYTAPEFYFRVPGRPPHIDAASDFYSVGISMLTLWSGEQVMLGLTERELIENKHTERLPYPKDLPADLLQLMRGLTLARPDLRWNFDTVTRWATGKLTADDALSTGVTELNIVFNSGRNLVAHTRSELATMMLQDMPLAKKYLYSGRMTRWFEDAGLNDLAVSVEDIVEKLYPRNQDAGFWSVVYMLDPAAPVYLPDSDFSEPESKWHKVDSAEELGEEIYNTLYCAQDGMSKVKLRIKLSVALSKPDSPIMIYLAAAGYQKVADEILENAQKESDDSSVYNSILDLVYTLSPSLPFVIGGLTADSVDDLLEILPEEGENLSNTDLTSQGFVKWLIGHDPALAGKVAMVIERGGTNNDVIYALSPQMDYCFNSDPESENRVFTPAEVGAYLNKELFSHLYSEEEEEEEVDEDEEDDFTLSLEQYLDIEEDGRVESYLRSKGKYDDLIEWMRSCLELDFDNADKYGPYDKYYAIYKIIRGFGATPLYPMNDDEDQTISKLSDLKRFKKSEILNALEHGHLGAWIATFFQENPEADLSEKFAYEKLTVQFVDFIRSICPDWEPVKNYDEAIAKVDENVKKASRTSGGVKVIKWIFGPVMFAILLFTLLATIIKGIPDYNPVDGHFWAFTITLAIIGTVAIYATDNSFGFFANIGASLVGGAVVTFLLKLLLGAASPYLTWIYAAIILVVGLVLFLYMRSELSVNYYSTDGINVANPGFQYRELEALHYAFVDPWLPYACTVEEYVEPFVKDNKRLIGQGIAWGMGGVLISIMLFFGLYYLSPAIGGTRSIGYEAINPGLKLAGPYHGTMGDNAMTLRLDSLTHFQVDSASIVVGKAKALALSGTVTKKDSDKFSALLRPALEDSLNTWYGEYRLDFDTKDSLVTGVFIPGRPNKKGEVVPQQISLKAGEAPAPKPSTTKKKKSSGSRSKSSAAASSGETTAAPKDNEAPAATEAASEPQKEAWQWDDTM